MSRPLAQSNHALVGALMSGIAPAVLSMLLGPKLEHVEHLCLQVLLKKGVVSCSLEAQHDMPCFDSSCLNYHSLRAQMDADLAYILYTIMLLYYHTIYIYLYYILRLGRWILKQEITNLKRSFVIDTLASRCPMSWEKEMLSLSRGKSRLPAVSIYVRMQGLVEYKSLNQVQSWHPRLTEHIHHPDSGKMHLHRKTS